MLFSPFEDEMESYKLYQQYANKFGNTFSEATLSGKTWNAAQVLMHRALAGKGPAVTDEMIWKYKKMIKTVYTYV